MDALQRIRRDHEVIRAKLNVIEASLHLPAETWFVLRELVFTLSRQLQDHMRREEALVMRCRKSMNPVVLAEMAVEHNDEPQLLRSINRMFIAEPGHSLAQIRPALIEAIAGLRRHMAEEEQALFPILEKFLKEQAAEGAVAAPACLHETMTVNRVVHDFPAARKVLENYFVNLPAEGCQCLDEVAWRHGMAADELLRTLEDVIGSCACKKEPEPSLALQK